MDQNMKKLHEEKAQKNPIHLLIIPFPAPSHVTPLLNLTRRLLTRRNKDLRATVVITPSTLPLFQPLLSSFPPPQLQPLIVAPPPPPSSGVSATPAPTCRVRALQALSDPIICWCRSHPEPPQFIIFDFLCFWTHKVSSFLRVPRVVFYSSGAFGSAVMYSTWRLAPTNPGNDLSHEVGLEDVDGSPRFKWSELSHLFRSGKPGDPGWDVFRADLLTNLTSWGAVFNTFSELEKVYIDHFKKEMAHNRVWAVGPLLQDDGTQHGGQEFQKLMTWLDGKVDSSVVYICFGSRTSLTMEESSVLRAALAYSNIHFIWCVQESDGDEGMDINTNENGFTVKGLAPQLSILKHKAVGGFVTHCGWNSIIESISTGVVMVAWPMGADQYANAQLVVDQLGLGFRVNCDGSKGVPDPRELAQLLIECVSVTRLERARVMSLGEVAASTVSGGGSALDFDRFVECLSENSNSVSTKYNT